jgi:hypothetical protein
MKKALSSGAKGLIAAFALALVVTVQPLAAQDVSDCRCVDTDGTAIENCSCFRAPNVRSIVNSWAPFATARPRIGVSVDVGQSARHDATGARVTDVLEDGPAEEAGLEEGDVIVSIDGHSLLESLSGEMEDDFDLDVSIPVQRLLAISGELEPGQEVAIEYLRDGEAHTLTVEAGDLDTWGNTFSFRSGGGDHGVLMDRLSNIGDRTRFEYRFDNEHMEDQMEDLQERLRENRGTLRLRSEVPNVLYRRGEAPEVLVRGNDGSFSFFGSDMDGVEMIEMKPGLAESFGTDGGVLITEVDDDSMLGLEAGDVLLRIGDRDASTPDRARRILRSYQEDEEITLHIMRQGREMSVARRLGNELFSGITSS